MSDPTLTEAKLATEAKSAPELYLTEEEFAARYHFGRRTVQRWRSSGDGPPYCRLGARRIFYRVADIERWAAGRTFRHRADELARQVDLQTDTDAVRLRPPSATGPIRATRHGRIGCSIPPPFDNCCPPQAWAQATAEVSAVAAVGRHVNGRDQVRGLIVPDWGIFHEY